MRGPMQPLPPEARCAVHPTNASSGTCGRCGSFICVQCLGPDGAPYCEKCRALGDVGRTPPPWERRGELGLIAAFIAQWKMSIFEPDKFWRSVPPEGSTGQALLYAWLVGLLQAVPAFLIQALNFSQVKSSLMTAIPNLPEWVDSLNPWVFSAALTLPVVVLFPASFYLSSAMVHLGCKLWGAGDRGFSATARVLGYAQGPLLVGWVPMLGFVGVVYVVVLQVMGISRLHGTTGGKAALGLLTIPILLTCCLGTGGFIFVLTMLGNAGMR